MELKSIQGVVDLRSEQVRHQIQNSITAIICDTDELREQVESIPYGLQNSILEAVERIEKATRSISLLIKNIE